MSAIVWEWLSFFVRWTHVMAGIAWIGSSFYFVHLDLSLKQSKGLPERAYGEAWQLHGGGFYHMVKYLVAPPHLPEHLTWFKWEAYVTWLSGMAMLVIVYYCNTELYMIDERVLGLTTYQAVALSVGGLVAGWLIYDRICRSKVGRNGVVLGITGLAILTALAFGFTQVFSGRGAFMQMGALIGTIMVANVFFVVIPNQRKVFADLIAGRTPDALLGDAAKQRSLHNNYLTLPVVFVMIGNHYPLAFATRFSWAILALVIVIGVLVRHFFNTRHKGLPSPWWTWAGAAACALAIVWLSSLGPAREAAAEARSPSPVADVRMEQVEEVILSRCSACHAAEPVWGSISAPPKGVALDTADRIRLHAGAIGMQAVLTHAMPPGNVTGITGEERRLLEVWLRAPR